MQAFDASSMIYAWDNYPIGQIPKIWAWIEREIRATRFVMPQVASKQVNDVSPDCGKWLGAVGMTRLPIGQDILTEAMRIKALLGIPGDKYHPDGVDENDLFIIACARHHGCRVVSEEAIQRQLPRKMARYKIPAVCALPGVMVDCINFIGLFKESQEVV
jgi:hypothetical protein